MAIRYQIRQNKIEKEYQAEQQRINDEYNQRQQNIANINTAIQTGLKITTDIGNKIGKQQAGEWTSKLQLYISQGISDGSIIKDDDGNYLTGDELYNNYESVIQKYIQDNPMPNNVFARNFINDNIQNRKESDLTRMLSGSIEGQTKQRNNNFNSFLEDITTRQYSNIKDYKDSVLLQYNVSELSGIEKTWYDSDTETDAKLLSLSLYMKNAGYSQEDIDAQVIKNRPIFQKQEFLENAAASYSMDVINGNITSYDWKNMIKKELEGVVPVFGTELNETMQNELMSMVSSKVYELDTEKRNEVSAMWNETVLPLLESMEENGKRINTETFNNVISSVQGFDMKYIDSELRTKIDRVILTNDMYDDFMSVVPQFQEIASSNATLSEKQAEFNRIYSGLNQSTKALVLSYNDKTPLSGDFLYEGAEQIINSQYMTFSYQPQINVSEIRSPADIQIENEEISNNLSKWMALDASVSFYNNNEKHLISSDLRNAIDELKKENPDIEDSEAIKTIQAGLVSMKQSLKDYGYSDSELNGYSASIYDSYKTEYEKFETSLKDSLSDSYFRTDLAVYLSLSSPQELSSADMNYYRQYAQLQMQNDSEYMKNLKLYQKEYGKDGYDRLLSDYISNKISEYQSVMANYGSMTLNDGTTLNSDWSNYSETNLLHLRSEKEGYAITDIKIDPAGYNAEMDLYNSIHNAITEVNGQNNINEIRSIIQLSKQSLTKEHYEELIGYIDSGTVGAWVERGTNMSAILKNLGYDEKSEFFTSLSRTLSKHFNNDIASNIPTDQLIDKIKNEAGKQYAAIVYSSSKDIIDKSEKEKVLKMFDSDPKDFYKTIYKKTGDSSFVLYGSDNGGTIREGINQVYENDGLLLMSLINKEGEYAKKSDFSKEDIVGYALSAALGFPAELGYSENNKETFYKNVYKYIDSMSTLDYEFLMSVVSGIVADYEIGSSLINQYGIRLKEYDPVEGAFVDNGGNYIYVTTNSNGGISNIYVKTSDSSEMVDISKFGDNQLKIQANDISNKLKNMNLNMMNIDNKEYAINYAYDYLMNEMGNEINVYEAITGKKLNIDVYGADDPTYYGKYRIMISFK